MMRYLFILFSIVISCVSLWRLAYLSNKTPLRTKHDITRLNGASNSQDDSTDKSTPLNKDITLSDGVLETKKEDLAHLQASYNEKVSFVGFIRVPRTGDSAILSFLEYESGLRTFRDYLFSATKYLSTCSKDYERLMPLCVYGPSPENVSFDHKDEQHVTNPYQVSENHPQEACPNLSLSRLGRYWERSLPFLNPLAVQSYDPVTRHASFRVSLSMVAMVREPFSRLRSLFYHMQKYCENSDHGKHMFTMAQYERLCANDMEGWLELLHTEGSGKTLGIPYQFHYFDYPDVDQAISNINGDSPEVFVLLNECFEESLRFMEEKLSLTPGATNSFLESPNAKLVDDADVPPEGPTDEHLREAAKKWFPDDYKFYNAAVAKFQEQLDSINLDSSLLQNPCTLNSGKVTGGFY